MTSVGYYCVRVISVNDYVPVKKIGYRSGSAFPFSVLNRFGYHFGSGNADSINLKKEYIFGSVYFRFRFGFPGRVTFEQLYLSVMAIKCYLLCTFMKYWVLHGRCEACEASLRVWNHTLNETRHKKVARTKISENNN